jgi:primary-amine oxidase
LCAPASACTIAEQGVEPDGIGQRKAMTMVQTQVRNALEPLSADEMREAVRILRDGHGLPERHRIMAISLREPAKGSVSWHLGASANGASPDREALIVLLDHNQRATVEATVSLTRGVVISWDVIEGVQAPVAFEEFFACEEVARADPRFQEALSKRGVTDMSLVMVDPWSAGWYEDPQGRRLLRALCWVRASPDDNGYMHPVENVAVLVDMHELRVVEVEDFGVVPIPWADGNYIEKYAGPLRTDLKPLDIVQPEGPSFQVDGYEVAWQNWRFRIGFTPREGLVLHTVAWEDKGRLRPVMYRAALSEMVVPYGDPSPIHRRKNAFDAGEYLIGKLTNSLVLGCDCLGHIHYFDAVINDGAGEPIVIQNAICMHEEDYGILWKHIDFRTDDADVRRARRLVVSSLVTVGNYDYGFFWYFYQDGTIEFEAKLTGILSTGAVPPGEKPTHGQLLNPDGLYAPIHQHFFSFRLDMDVDGDRNAIYEVHTEIDPPGPENPMGNAFRTVATKLRGEHEARQHIDPLRGRVWTIASSERRNAVGSPTAYQLVPHGNVGSMVSDEASVSKRATFMSRHLWVTPYAPDELYAAGPYPNQHPGGAGLPEYTKDDRSIEDTDLVVWYTLGSHHPVRLEDWPVMPVSRAGFALRPFGFFDRNPALDAPKPHRHGATGANGSSCH